MKITDHGTWRSYKPENPPKAAPPGTMFACRESDGVDWYDYVHPGTNFDPGSIKLTVVDGSVGAATRDATGLFPGNARVLEVFEVTTDDPQSMFGMKVYDAAKKAFSDPPPQDFPNPIADLLKRLEALENKA